MATEYLFSNNATTTLAQSVSPTATVLNVASGDGSMFPNPGQGQAFAVTLVDAATGLTNEICYCTSRSGDQLTVTRGREGTNATSWQAGDTCANYITADVMESWLQESDLNGYLPLSGGQLTGPLNISGTNYTNTNTRSGSLYYGSATGSKINGYTINNPAVSSTSGQTYLFDMWMEVNPGVLTYGVLRAWTWQGERRWTFNENGGITSSVKGAVAFASDLAPYATTSYVNTQLATKQPTGDYALNSRVSAYFAGSGGNATVSNLQGVNWAYNNTESYVQVSASGVVLALPTYDYMVSQLTSYAQPRGNYQPAGDYVDASTISYGTVSGGTYTKIGNVLTQAFTIYVPSNGTNSHRISYPMAFSGSSTATFNLTDTGQSRSVSLSENTQPDASGFNIAVSVHGNSTAGSTDGLTLTVIAQGLAA